MIKKIFLIGLFLLLGLLMGAVIYFNQAIYQSIDTNSTKTMLFNVIDNQENKVSHDLYSQKLIKSAQAFEFYVKYKKMNLAPGLYELSPAMSIADIASKISNGEVVVYKVTIPEGWRISQIADRLDTRQITSRQDFIKAAEGSEGYLFPDTYFIKSGTTAKQIVDLMKDNFVTRTKNISATPDIVILASIVEREVSKNDDRSQIAAVYSNRLKQNMKLQADPTVQYAKGSWASITQADYKDVISPYNTYLHSGLPPGPICNPGLASLQAAANPAQSPYLFFFHTKDGRAIFSKTFDEHESNIQKYRAGKL